MDTDMICNRCGGKGKTWVMSGPDDGEFEGCDECDGTGRVLNNGDETTLPPPNASALSALPASHGKMLVTRLPPQHEAKLRELAAARAQSVSALIRDALIDWLAVTEVVEARRVSYMADELERETNAVAATDRMAAAIDAAKTPTLADLIGGEDDAGEQVQASTQEVVERE